MEVTVDEDRLATALSRYTTVVAENIKLNECLQALRKLDDETIIG